MASLRSLSIVLSHTASLRSLKATMCDKYTEQVLIHSDPTTNKTMEK